jgi:hypothetical protein
VGGGGRVGGGGGGRGGGGAVRRLASTPPCFTAVVVLHLPTTVGTSQPCILFVSLDSLPHTPELGVRTMPDGLVFVFGAQWRDP